MPVEKAPAGGDEQPPDEPAEQPPEPLAQPEPLAHWHELAADWYQSLAASGEAQFYEPSDWQAARWCAELMTLALAAHRPAPLVAQVRGLMTDLLVTEGARRRALIELERRPPGGSDAAGDGVVAELDAYRRRTRSGSG